MRRCRGALKWDGRRPSSFYCPECAYTALVMQYYPHIRRDTPEETETKDLRRFVDSFIKCVDKLVENANYEGSGTPVQFGTFKDISADTLEDLKKWNAVAKAIPRTKKGNHGTATRSRHYRIPEHGLGGPGEQD